MKYLKLIVAIVFNLSLNTTRTQEYQTLKNSVLWKIEHADLEKPSYVLGTLHMMCEEDFELKDKVVQVLEKSDALVLEVNLSDADEMKSMQEILTDSKKISEELTTEQYAILDKKVQGILNMPLVNFDSYGLGILYFTLTSKMLPCSKPKFMEMELMQLAQKNGVSIGALETVKEQMDMISKGFTPEYNYNQILLFDAYKKDFALSIDAYTKEDIETAVGFITKKDYMDENATKYVQVVRNKNWVEKMPGMMKDKANVFAVGTAHLVGKEGVIHLLREKGYTVTAVLK